MANPVGVFFGPEVNNMAILTHQMIKFIKNTIMGHESGMYKSIAIAKESSTDKDKINLSLLQGKKILELFANVSENYFNKCYKSLVLRDDEYIVKIFDDMKAQFGHSQLCLLIIIANSCMKIHFEMDREKLDVSSYDNYMKSVKAQLDTLMGVDFITMSTASFGHNCSGEDITKCDPTIKNFTFKTTAVYK
jgi:ABC-type siderophore export system fused ATPase/permease subunit